MNRLITRVDFHEKVLTGYGRERMDGIGRLVIEVFCTN